MKQAKKIISVLLVVLMLAVSMPVSAAFIVDFESDERIQYGTYPQTLITDEETIIKLNAEKKAWASYQYYSGTGMDFDGEMEPNDTMRFADFFCEGEKYRAVTFSEYRAYRSDFIRSAENSKQDDNGFFTDTVYYFKYEPLSWRILDAEKGLVICDSLIDAQPYHNMVYKDDNGYWRDATASVYASDYATSDIRTWLNESFFETAFTETQKENIKTTELSNNARNTKFSSASTADKVFMLSHDDLWDGYAGRFYPYEKTKARGTDYAKCQGLDVKNNDFGDSTWWLRTPGDFGGGSACTVLEQWGVYYYTYLNVAGFGVRPSCELNALISDTAVSQTLFSAQKHVHSFVPGETRPATCVATGEQSFICDCGALESEEIPIDSNNHVNTEITDAVMSTCIEKGFSTGVYCSDCKQYLSGHEEQPLGNHTTVLQNNTPAGCTTEGYTGDQYCTTCKQIIIKGSTVYALGHTEPNGEGKCDRCGEQLLDPSELPHPGGRPFNPFYIIRLVFEFLKKAILMMLGK